jgi:competence protein ComEC
MFTPWQAPEGCPAQVSDHDRLRREGALALRRTQGEKHHFVVEAVRPDYIDRPWSPAASGDKPTRIGARSAPARPVDATPAADDLQPDD